MSEAKTLLDVAEAWRVAGIAMHDATSTVQDRKRASMLYMEISRRLRNLAIELAEHNRALRDALSQERELANRLRDIPANAVEQIKRLRDALCWYADEKNHQTTRIDADGRGMHSPMNSDEGARARAVLKE